MSLSCGRCKTEVSASTALTKLTLKTPTKESSFELCVHCLDSARRMWGNFLNPPSLSQSQQLTDSSPMPKGKYSKTSPPTKMRDVPASYLDWFMGQDWRHKWPDVLDYCERNKKVITAQLEEENENSSNYYED